MCERVDRTIPSVTRYPGSGMHTRVAQGIHREWKCVTRPSGTWYSLFSVRRYPSTTSYPASAFSGGCVQHAMIILRDDRIFSWRGMNFIRKIGRDVWILHEKTFLSWFSIFAYGSDISQSKIDPLLWLMECCWFYWKCVQDIDVLAIEVEGSVLRGEIRDNNGSSNDCTNYSVWLIEILNLLILDFKTF